MGTARMSGAFARFFECSRSTISWNETSAGAPPFEARLGLAGQRLGPGGAHDGPAGSSGSSAFSRPGAQSFQASAFTLHVLRVPPPIPPGERVHAPRTPGAAADTARTWNSSASGRASPAAAAPRPRVSRCHRRAFRCATGCQITTSIPCSALRATYYPGTMIQTPPAAVSFLSSTGSRRSLPGRGRRSSARSCWRSRLH